MDSSFSHVFQAADFSFPLPSTGRVWTSDSDFQYLEESAHNSAAPSDLCQLPSLLPLPHDGNDEQRFAALETRQTLPGIASSSIWSDRSDGCADGSSTQVYSDNNSLSGGWKNPEFSGSNLQNSWGERWNGLGLAASFHPDNSVILEQFCFPPLAELDTLVHLINCLFPYSDIFGQLWPNGPGTCCRAVECGRFISRIVRERQKPA